MEEKRMEEMEEKVELSGKEALKLPERHGFLGAILADYLGMAAVLAGLILVFSLLTSHFFTLTTFRTIANQIPDAIIIATGMTFVVIIGGIDLSVGSVLALSSAVLGVCLVDLKLPLPVAIAACLIGGVICGGLN